MEAFLQRVSHGEIEQACELLDPPVQDALKEQGGCEGVLSQQSVTAASKQLDQARVNEDKINVTGDTAVVDSGAITLKGKSVATPISRLIRHDDRWWITIPS